MKLKTAYITIVAVVVFGNFPKAQHADLTNAIVDENMVFEGKDEVISIEAEFFYKQTKTEVRKWYRSSKLENPMAGKDGDSPHVFGASHNAYLEILPDTRVTHDDPLLKGENFSDKPGELAVLHYKVKVDVPGRYYVWAQAFSTGSEDNGVHIGADGEWPSSGRRIQWCDGKNQWTWSNKQRTKEVHCGIPDSVYLDISAPGVHDIQISMREDGFELDKFILTNDVAYTPKGMGPKVVASGSLPAKFPEVKKPILKKNYFKKVADAWPENKSISAQEFPSVGTDFYRHGKNWLAINPTTHKEAVTSLPFPFESGKYDVVFVGVGENDGRSTFRFSVNSKEIGSFQPKDTNSMFEEGKDINALWKAVELKKGDKITVFAQVGTDGKEFCRARWAGNVFAPVGKGMKIQDFPSTFDPN
ncbi:hypothetical protein [Reichenbachiella ulvae]|uniref:Gylcosyl hydrolase 115 C-terminal domain-containing protein n=1 Tax=Reichenbachiella ulvae TaxID=2980104 RepID=A0ABT3CT31_9BACT|nr:hypothetical protein [Reichenbachiella ulvae]MCV9386674.1 hypothetical protein [Reichenbachiella ulvae]